MRTIFTLPVGALIEISGRTYEYVGYSRFVGQTEQDVPVLIEGLFHVPGMPVGVVNIEPSEEEHSYNERVVFFCER